MGSMEVWKSFFRERGKKQITALLLAGKAEELEQGIFQQVVVLYFYFCSVLLECVRGAK